MKNNRAYEKMEAIDKILREYDIWADTYPHAELPVVCVEINKGDWKHEHGRCDWVLRDAGYTLMKEEVTWEDGGDVYSSIHYFA